MSGSEEWAKATQELAKFGTTCVEKVGDLGDYVSKKLDEPIDVAAEILTSRLKFVLFKNNEKIKYKVNKILNEKKVSNVRSLPPKLGIQMLEYACLEEEEYLQDIWCNLIANSLDPNFDMEIKYAFIDILKNLTSLDAKILKYIYDASVDKSKLYQITESNENQININKIIESIEAQDIEIKLSLYNLKRVQCVWNYPSLIRNKETKHATFIPNADESYTLTPLGVALIKACSK
jgi:hypothetical protein